MALGGFGWPGAAQFRRSRRAGSEPGVTAALNRAPRLELTVCVSPTLFRPHSVRRLAKYSRHVSYLPCIPRNGEPVSSDGKVFVPGPRLFDGKLCFTQCFRQVPPGANPLLLSEASKPELAGAVRRQTQQTRRGKALTESARGHSCPQQVGTMQTTVVSRAKDYSGIAADKIVRALMPPESWSWAASKLGCCNRKTRGSRRHAAGFAIILNGTSTAG